MHWSHWASWFQRTEIRLMSNLEALLLLHLEISTRFTAMQSGFMASEPGSPGSGGTWPFSHGLLFPAIPWFITLQKVTVFSVPSLCFLFSTPLQHLWSSLPTHIPVLDFCSTLFFLFFYFKLCVCCIVCAGVHAYGGFFCFFPLSFPSSLHSPSLPSFFSVSY